MPDHRIGLEDSQEKARGQKFRLCGFWARILYSVSPIGLVVGGF